MINKILIRIMRMRKEDIAIIVFGIILVVIVFTIVYITTTSVQVIKKTQPSPSISPTQKPQPIEPPLTYNKTDSGKLLNYFENRRNLSSNDAFAKANILSLLPSNEQSGVIYQSSDISIEYVHSADIFLVEILTTNIQTAKNEASAWFTENGMSQQGICTLPVEFYMNYDIANELRNSNIIFSPLPNGC